MKEITINQFADLNTKTHNTQSKSIQALFAVGCPVDLIEELTEFNPKHIRRILRRNCPAQYLTYQIAS